MSAVLTDFNDIQMGYYNYNFIVAYWIDHRDYLGEKLQAFAGQLRKTGRVVSSEKDETEENFEAMLAKNWDKDTKEVLKNIQEPLMLILENNFVDFDPQHHQWAIVVLSTDPRDKIDAFFEKLAVITLYGGDIFAFVRDIESRKQYPFRFPVKPLVSAEVQHSDEQYKTDFIRVKPVFRTVPRDFQYRCDVFVIMPFEPSFKALFSDFIVSAGANLGLSVKRGDDFFSNHHIMDEVWYALYNARIVVADCTGRNPNVFYELGIAHTLGKPTILLTQEVKDAPFDVAGRRFIQYENTLGGGAKLKQSLQETMEKLLSEGK